MQEPNPVQFADIIHTNNKHVEKLQIEVYELTQKLALHRDLPTELTPLIEHLKILEDSDDRFTKQLTSIFHNINPLLTDVHQLLNLQKLILFYSIF